MVACYNTDYKGDRIMKKGKKRAPGKSFRRGLSLIELFQMFPNSEVAEDWFVRMRWPDGVACPQCGSIKIHQKPKRKPTPYRCRDCRKGLLGQDLHCDGQFQSGPPEMGHCHLPVHHQHQGSFEHEAPPRSQDHPEIRVAYAAPPPKDFRVWLLHIPRPGRSRRNLPGRQGTQQTQLQETPRRQGNCRKISRCRVPKIAKPIKSTLRS